MSCAGPYEGFDELTEGTYFKLTRLGGETASLENARFILLRYSFCSNSTCHEVEPSKEIFIDARDFRALNQFQLGDRLMFLISTNGTTAGEMLNIPSEHTNYPVIALCDIASFVDSSIFFGAKQDYPLLMAFKEKRLIERWLENGSYKPDSNGIFQEILSRGEGDSIVKGSTVALSYKAFFPGNILFDATDNWADTFEFEFGIPDQVISGLELALNGKRQGFEAKIIIPSHLAFGEGGSSSGIVPPFEPLKYEIKILKVKTSKNEGN